MAFTYDPTTDRGKVRLLATDTDVAYPLFTDAEIDAFLTLNSNVLIAAAMTLETIASNEVLTQKVIKLLDLSTNGAAVGKELRERAKVLRDQAAGEESGFDYAEMVFDQFGYMEKITKEALRSG